MVSGRWLCLNLTPAGRSQLCFFLLWIPFLSPNGERTCFEWSPLLHCLDWPWTSGFKWSSGLRLLSSWDYEHAPVCPTNEEFCPNPSFIVRAEIFTTSSPCYCWGDGRTSGVSGLWLCLLLFLPVLQPSSNMGLRVRPRILKLTCSQSGVWWAVL